MYNVQCLVISVHCTVHTVQCKDFPGVHNSFVNPELSLKLSPLVIIFSGIKIKDENQIMWSSSETQSKL